LGSLFHCGGDALLGFSLHFFPPERLFGAFYICSVLLECVSSHLFNSHPDFL
jgi:hypothetical protein